MTEDSRPGAAPEPPPDEPLAGDPRPLGPLDRPGSLDRHRVLAVLVAHDGTPWIGRALDAVAAQSVAPARLQVVDTGSTDGTGELIARRHGPSVLTLDRATGFGAAVAAVLDATSSAPGLPVPDGVDGPVVDWLWLLHDDCAPQPDALEALLRAVDDAPSVGIAGPKVVGWADPRHLLEVGVTISRSGARETGLERQEQDQGQHDTQRSVLAVSTAGMLVRRDVWDELGGLDPHLTVFRDDVDLGWRANAAGHRVLVVPNAVVHHAEAAAHRRRRISVGPDQPYRLDRQHAMHVLLANSPAVALPWVVVRLVVGSLVRALGLLIGKDPGLALAELRALGTTAAHPGPVREARRRTAPARRVAYRDLRGLLASRGSQVQHGLEVLGAGFSSSAATTIRSAEPTGGDAADDELLDEGEGAVRRFVRRPGVALTLVVLLVALLAERSLIGDGVLSGGALLAPQGGASALWSAYAAWWHPVGVGSPTAASTYAGVLGAASWFLLGKVDLLVDVLLLLCVPLAAASAYAALRDVVDSIALRVWAAATYAVLPVATGAIAGGRLGTALALVLVPALARPALRLARVLGPAPTWRTAYGTGLLLALLVAFAPVLWLLAVVLAVVAVATTARGRAAASMLAVSLAVAPVLLVPWTGSLIRHPSYLLAEAGAQVPAATAVSPSPLTALLLGPGGPGTPAAWVGLGVLLAGAAALVRGHRRAFVLPALVVAVVALAGAVLLARTEVPTPQIVAGLPGWSGPLLVVAAAALLAAGAVAGEGARTVLASRSFGWRQPVVAMVVALCVLGPAVCAIDWLVRGADDPLQRGAVSTLPAFVVADSSTPAQPRTLVLRPDGPGVVTYRLVRGDGARLGEAEAAPAVSVAPQLSTTVSDLASGRGGVAGPALVPYGVRYVVLDDAVTRGGDPAEIAVEARALSRTLDGTAGVRRLSSAEGDAVWRVVGPTGRARLVPDAPTRPVVVVPAGEVGIDAAVPPGWAGGRLVLADAADSGWHAHAGGHELARQVAGGWAQAFVVPSGTTSVQVGFDQPARTRWIAVELILIVVVVVLALPSRRREGEGEDA